MWLTKRSAKAGTPATEKKKTPKQAEVQSEEFLQLPRVEFLIDQADGTPGDLAKHIVNRLESLERFSMQVPDNTMKGAGLCKGDSAVVASRETINDGDVVAVTLGEKVLIRRYSNSHNRIRLESTAEPDRILIVDPETPGFTVLGKVIQVIREIS